MLLRRRSCPVPATRRCHRPVDGADPGQRDRRRQRRRDRTARLDDPAFAASVTSASDIARAETFSLPVLLILLIVIFGRFVAAVSPLIIGIMAAAAIAVAASLTVLPAWLGVLGPRINAWPFGGGAAR